jgi:translation initiation factor 1
VLEDRHDSTNSLDDILRELDEEKIHIVISKDIRRFRKSVTVVKGLQDLRRDVESLTRELKMKVGTGGTYKDGQIVLQGDHRDYVRNFLLEKGFNENSIEVR